MRSSLRALGFGVALAAAVAGCGGGNDGGGGNGGGSSGGRSQSGEAGEVQDTIITWLLEGDCDLMTTQFLADQAIIGDTRAEHCDTFRNTFVEKQYRADDVIVSDIEITGAAATAVVGDDFSNVESTYTLVKAGGGWQIDAVDF